MNNVSFVMRKYSNDAWSLKTFLLWWPRRLVLSKVFVLAAGLLGVCVTGYMYAVPFLCVD